jgi:hypothetical protein
MADAASEGRATPPGPRPTGRFRLATYNVEWFHALFDPAGEILRDNAWSGRQDVTRAMQIDALATVFRRLDADAILVVEAPDISRERDGLAALRNFGAYAGLRANAAVVGFPNQTQQELMLLYDPAVVTARHDPQTDGAPGFDGEFRIDLDIDDTEDLVTFSKPPLELAMTTPIGALRLIGVHVKSKAPHGARDSDHAMKLAIANRRKQLAQCIWLRHRIEALLERDTPLVVLGDLNDGPGLDVYETLFGRSGLEIVMGADAPAKTRLYDPHAVRALERRLMATAATARFYIAAEERFLSALLDYILVSPALHPAARHWRIWHPFDDPECYADENLREALLIASDHFPVTLDFDTTAQADPGPRIESHAETVGKADLAR